MENKAFKKNIEEVDSIQSRSNMIGGTPLATGFSLNAQMPLDDRQFAFTLEERDAIPAIRRWEGMTVFVAEGHGYTYQLVGGIGNEHWVKFGTSQASDVDGLHKVATSGDYNDLENKPENLSEFNNDTGFIALAYGGEQPEEEHKDLWFDVTGVSQEEEEGLFLVSELNVTYKVSVTNDGRLYTQAVDRDPRLFRQDIIVVGDNDLRYKLRVSDDGNLFVERTI